MEDVLYFSEQIVMSRRSQETSKERKPLADLTEIISPSSVNSPTAIKDYEMAKILDHLKRGENRKRSAEPEEMVSRNNTSPPDSMQLRPDVVSIQQTPGSFKYRRRISNQHPIDYFKKYPIPIEVMRNIFSYLNKKDMCSAMQTCRFFYNAGVSCENWETLDLHWRHVYDSKLVTILNRKVQVCRLSDARIGADQSSPLPLSPLPDGSPAFFHLTHLDLGRATFARIEILLDILSKCWLLEALCLEGFDLTRFGSEIGRYIGQNRGLKSLDLSLTRGLTKEAIESIVKGCQSLLELNLAWCDLDNPSVKVLVNNLSQSLKKINLSGTKNKNSIEDSDIRNLVRCCPFLDEVDLSDNTSLSDSSIPYLIMLDLERLSLNRCYNISPHLFLELQEVLYLNVFGTMTDQGQQSLREHLINTYVNTEILSYIAKPTIPPAVSSIWKQRTRDLY